MSDKGNSEHSPSSDPFLFVQKADKDLSNALKNRLNTTKAYKNFIKQILDGKVEIRLQNQITHSLDEFGFLINHLKEKAKDIKKLVQDDTLFEGMKMEQYENSAKTKLKNYILETLGELEDKLESIFLEIKIKGNIIDIYDDYQKLVKIFEKLFIINTDSPSCRKRICSFGTGNFSNKCYWSEFSLQNLGDLPTQEQEEKNNFPIFSCFGGEKLYNSISDYNILGQKNDGAISPIYQLGGNNYLLTYKTYLLNGGILRLRKELQELREEEKRKKNNPRRGEILEENGVINEIVETITSDGELEILRFYYTLRNLLQKVGWIIESYKDLDFQREEALENIENEKVTKEEIEDFAGKIKNGNFAIKKDETLKEKLHRENIVISFIASGKLDDFNQEEARNFTSYLKASNLNEERIYSVLVDYINIIKPQGKIIVRDSEKEKYLIELEKYIFELSLKINSQENGERAFGRIPIQDFTDIVLDFLRNGKNEKTEENLIQYIKAKKEKLKEYLDGLMEQYDINQDIILEIQSKIDKIEEINTEQIIQRITREAKKSVEEQINKKPFTIWTWRYPLPL